MLLSYIPLRHGGSKLLLLLDCSQKTLCQSLMKLFFFFSQPSLCKIGTEYKQFLKMDLLLALLGRHRTDTVSVPFSVSTFLLTACFRQLFIPQIRFLPEPHIRLSVRNHHRPHSADCVFSHRDTSYTATASSSWAIVVILSPHHSGRLALTIASAIGGHTAFPQRATCFVFP